MLETVERPIRKKNHGLVTVACSQISVKKIEKHNFTNKINRQEIVGEKSYMGICKCTF